MSAVTNRMSPTTKIPGDDKDVNRNSGKTTRLLSSKVATNAMDCKQII